MRKAYFLELDTSHLQKELYTEDITEERTIELKAGIVSKAEAIQHIHNEIAEIKTIYERFKSWELAIELPIQATVTITFTFMKRSITTISSVFQNWFVSQSLNLSLIILMSLKSIILVQVVDESARKKQFLGTKAKMMLIPMYILTSISRIAAIVLFLGVPLGLFNILGHYSVEKERLQYQGGIIVVHVD